VGQIATLIANSPPASLPSNIEPNPEEQANTISLRSERQLEQAQMKNTEKE